MNEDLKWLAENLSEWPCMNYHKVMRANNAQGYVCVTGNSDGGYTRAQWQAARDELSGKPSWNDAPEWAESLAQWDGGSWEWYDAGIESMYVGEVSNWLGYKKRSSAGKGRVLGDWRNTLERRPVVHSRDSDEALGKELKVYESKQWRGPGYGLPPVGAVLEAWFDDGRRCWHKAHVVGYHPSEANTIAVSLIGDHESRLIWSDMSGIRPDCSEEDKAVEEMLCIMECGSGELAARALYRAGYRKQESK